MASSLQEPPISGVGTLTKVSISSMTLLKIVQHGTRSLPELCGGSLLGIDDGKGGIEVTDCFAYPSVAPPMANPGEEDDEEALGQTESDVSEFRQDMMKLLKDVNSDDFCVGWYRTVNMGEWCNTLMVEQQFEHQEECDQGTGKAKSVLIVYDPYQSEKGVLCMKALRLTDAFMEIMRARANPDARYAGYSDLALSKLRMEDVFYEIPIEFDTSSALANMALTELKIGGSPQPAFDAQDVSLDRLVLSTDPYLEKNIVFLIEEMDDLQEQQRNASQFQKQLARQRLLQDKWVAQRKAENAARMERGEEPLPLQDLNNPAFKPLKDSSKFGSLLIRKQIDIYCEQINAWSVQSLEKLFLVGAIQQQQL